LQGKNLNNAIIYNNQDDLFDSVRREPGMFGDKAVEVVIHEGREIRDGREIPFVWYQTFCVHGDNIVYVLIQGYGENMAQQGGKVFASLEFAE